MDSYNFDFKNNNTISVSNLLIDEYGCSKKVKEQLLKDGIKVYKDTLLCNPSKESKAIHIFTGTWLSNKKSVKNKIATFFKLRLTTNKRAELYSKIFR